MAGVAIERYLGGRLWRGARKHPEAIAKTALAGGVVLGLAIIIGQAIEEADRDQNDLARLADLPQFTGRLVGLTANHEIPYGERSPEKIRDMLLGLSFSNKARELEGWRVENNITPGSIQIIKPQDPGKPFTVRVPEGKKVLLTNLPTKNPPAVLSEGNIIPETTVFDVNFILKINEERYGVIIGTTCLEKTDDGNERCAATPFFFKAEGIPIYEGLPSAPVFNSTVIYPQTKMAIHASSSGRQLPRSEPPPRVIRSGHSTVFPGPKSYFWAAKGIR